MAVAEQATGEIGGGQLDWGGVEGGAPLGVAGEGAGGGEVGGLQDAVAGLLLRCSGIFSAGGWPSFL